MDIKMIATDLDGTLLRSDKTISAYTARILSACRQRGIRIVFATARSENSCKRYTELIKPDAIVSNGGALARIGDKTVYRATMCIETINKLLLSCMEQPSVGYITIDTDKGYFVNKPVDENDPGWIEYMPAYYVDFSRGMDCDAYKLTVSISDEKTACGIVSKFPGIDVIRFSGEDWYRFAGKEADKWRGVQAVAAAMGIETENIASFGDDLSDIKMLRGCGYGMAVANAAAEVKAAARRLCGANDSDGVAKWLEEYIL